MATTEGTLVDTNFLLDLVTDDPVRADWSIRQLDASSKAGEAFTESGFRASFFRLLRKLEVTGHKTEAMVALYTEGADRRRSADTAIERMEQAAGRRRKS